jgi:hypothetical protein
LLRLKYQTVVAASPEKVFEALTGYPVNGQVSGEELQNKYGKYLSGEGPSLTFREDIGGGVTWDCLFEPPMRRTMRTVDSTWSDRIDEFFILPEGTLWEITWDVKAGTVTTLTKWITYHLLTKRTIWRRMIEPVLRDIYESNRALDAR